MTDPKKKKPKISNPDNRSREEKMQQLLTLESILPCSNAARSIASLSQYISMGDSGIKGLDTNTLEESLGAFNDNLRRGSMHHVESMLLD